MKWDCKRADKKTGIAVFTESAFSLESAGEKNFCLRVSLIYTNGKNVI